MPLRMREIRKDYAEVARLGLLLSQEHCVWCILNPTGGMRASC